MTVKRKIPERKCLGCGEMFPQKELVRVVKTRIKDETQQEEQFEISLDLVGKKAGRGAYVCRNTECFEKCIKAKRFQRALSCQIPDEVIEQMKQELSDNE